MWFLKRFGPNEKNYYIVSYWTKGLSPKTSAFDAGNELA
jgi:hypothetical protein